MGEKISVQPCPLYRAREEKGGVGEGPPKKDFFHMPVRQRPQCGDPSRSGASAGIVESML